MNGSGGSGGSGASGASGAASDAGGTASPVAAVTVDLDAAVPVYEQLRAQVTSLVAIGALAAGDRLPASRDLARDLGIAVGTVQRAYRELESSGVVLSRRRVGTIVAGQASVGTDAAGALVGRVRELVADARASGLGDDAVLDLVRGVLSTS